MDVRLASVLDSGSLMVSICPMSAFPENYGSKFTRKPCFTAEKVLKSLHVIELKKAIYTIKIIFTGPPKKVTQYSVICILYTHLFLCLYPSYVTAAKKCPRRQVKNSPGPISPPEKRRIRKDPAP